MRHSLNKLGAFLRDGSGQFAVIGAVTMSMLALSVGFAVNTAQALLIKSSLRDALDAAVTSTARDITTGKIKVADASASIDRFLQANSNADFAVGKKFTLTNVTVDKAMHTVEATAVANVQLAFPIFTTKDPRVSSTTAAVYSDKTIEVAMMLDITGSMAGQKIKDLKTAAENAVGVMLDGQDPKNPRIRVAIVPYAEAVNTGKLAGDNVFRRRAVTSGQLRHRAQGQGRQRRLLRRRAGRRTQEQEGQVLSRPHQPRRPHLDRLVG